MPQAPQPSRRSNSATRFRIERVEASLASTTVMYSASEWTNECLAEVLIRPTVAGQYRGSIRFHVRTEGNEQPLELTSDVQFVGVSTAAER